MNLAFLTRFLALVLCSSATVAASAVLEPGSRLREGTVAAGGHSCALRANGRVQCWGYNRYGQLGTGNTETSGVPVFVKNLSNAVAVTAGPSHTCALIADGTVRCWGRNDRGQTGLAGSSDALEPYAVPGLSQVVAIDAGSNHTCAILVSGEAKCWGYNLFGQLGNATNAGSASPVSVIGVSRAISISSGENHSCAVQSNGRVKCWGLGTDGRLGQGEFASSNTAVPVTGLVEAVSVSAGNFHTCATTARGRAWCWGENGFAQLGDGTEVLSASPRLVKTATGFLGGVIGLGAGGAHTCALLSGGTVHCWGQNYEGQTGNGSAPYAEPKVFLPTPVLGATGKPVTGMAALAVGPTFNCGVLASGAARCWGANTAGQLGSNEAVASASTARSVVGFNVGAKAIALATGRSHSCALLGTGKVKCWGLNDRGQLGNGQVSTTAPLGNVTPGEVVGLGGAVALDLGDDRSCALLSNSQVKCWGDDRPAPFLIPNLTGVRSLAVHSNHSCATLASGGVRCWGQDLFGQLGNGPGSPADGFTPVAVSGLGGIKRVAVSVFDSCAVSATGDVSCWGQGWQIGDLRQESPVFLTGGATGIVVDSGYGCAMPGTVGGVLGDRRCVGHNRYGNFGNGTEIGSENFVRVGTPATITSLALAERHACARLANGTGRCWGRDTLGQLGNGSIAEQYAIQPSPVTVKTLFNATAVEVGEYFSCALLGNGGVKCWGFHEEGRLGNPVASPASSPVSVLGI